MVSLNTIASGKVGSLLQVQLGGLGETSFCYVPAGVLKLGPRAGLLASIFVNNWRFICNALETIISLDQPFWLARTETTQAEWEAVMGYNPSFFKGPKLPVENVSWNEVQDYLREANAKGLLPQGWRFALPTDSQWQYACHAGKNVFLGQKILDEHGWHKGNSGGCTHEVATKKPNSWGLFDMHGNVSEWCDDLVEDPDGAHESSIAQRMSRGGSWDVSIDSAPAPIRSSSNQIERSNDLGFRLAIVRS